MASWLRFRNAFLQPIQHFYYEFIFFITYPVILFLSGGLLTTGLLIFGNTVVRALMVAYIVFAFRSTQHKYCGYTFSPRIQNFLRASSGWQHMAKKFPVTVVKTADIGIGPHLIANHPHGVICIGAISGMHFTCNGWRKLFPKVNVTMHIMKLLFFIPFTREYLLLSGGAGSDKESIVNTLKSGRSALLIPGGSLESSLVPADNIIPIVLKTRKGFIRIAMEQRVPLVPTYSFGEHDLYTLYHPSGFVGRIIEKIRMWFGYSILLFAGSFVLLPKPVPIKVVVGAAIRTDDYEGDLTEELVAAKHEEYKRALLELFNKHRGNFYPADSELTFV